MVTSPASESTAEISSAASEKATSAKHWPQSRRVYQLEGALVLLIIVGVLSAAGTDGGVVLVDIATVLISCTSPV
jgi:hypothetical protein